MNIEELENCLGLGDRELLITKKDGNYVASLKKFLKADKGGTYYTEALPSTASCYKADSIKEALEKLNRKLELP